MNELSKRELWQKIQQFNLDDPSSAFPFSKKLQKENNWSKSFTKKAIEEYKNFIYLCCVLPNGASPSDIVDKVWHLHLTYTTNYWKDFCQDTLQKEIHHHPSKGGKNENEKHTNWYNETLEAYEGVFRVRPPKDIWPNDSYEIQENIYDPSYFKKTVSVFIAFVVLLIGFTRLYHVNGPDFLLYFAIIAIAGIICLSLLQINKSKKLDQIIQDHLPQKYSTWQISKFLYGPHRTYQAALIDLLKTDRIELEDSKFRLNNDLKSTGQDDENPIWDNIIEDFKPGDKFIYEEGFERMDQEKLKHPGFEKLYRLSKKVDYQKFIIPGIVFGIGIARLMQGMANNKPVNFLVMEIGVFTIIVTAIAANFSYTTTLFDKIKKIWNENNASGHSNNILNNYSILGVIAIAGFAEYITLDRIFTANAPERRVVTGSGTCSSCTGGTSCGSSCGSGCGGCGGGD